MRGCGVIRLRRTERVVSLSSKMAGWRVASGRGVACQVTRARQVEGADGSRRSRGRRGCRSRRVRLACSANVLRPPPAGGGLLLEFAAQAKRTRRHVAPEAGARFSPVEGGRVANDTRSRCRLPGHSRQTGGGCRRVEALEGSSRLQEPPEPPGPIRECPPASACGRRPPPSVRRAGQAAPAPRGSGGGSALSCCFAVADGGRLATIRRTRRRTRKRRSPSAPRR